MVGADARTGACTDAVRREGHSPHAQLLEKKAASFICLAVVQGFNIGRGARQLQLQI